MPFILVIIAWLAALNIFTGGVYLALQGVAKRRRLKESLLKAYAVIRRRKWSFKGILEWHVGNVPLTTVKRGLYIIPRRERIKIYYNPQTFQVELNIWSHNGTAEVMLGVVAATFAVAGAALLLV